MEIKTYSKKTAAIAGFINLVADVGGLVVSPAIVAIGVYGTFTGDALGVTGVAVFLGIYLSSALALGSFLEGARKSAMKQAWDRFKKGLESKSIQPSSYTLKLPDIGAKEDSRDFKIFKYFYKKPEA